MNAPERGESSRSDAHSRPLLHNVEDCVHSRWEGSVRLFSEGLWGAKPCSLRRGLVLTGDTD